MYEGTLAFRTIYYITLHSKGKRFGKRRKKKSIEGK